MYKFITGLKSNQTFTMRNSITRIGCHQQFPMEKLVSGSVFSLRETRRVFNSVKQRQHSSPHQRVRNSHRHITWLPDERPHKQSAKKTAGN